MKIGQNNNKYYNTEHKLTTFTLNSHLIIQVFISYCLIMN